MGKFDLFKSWVLSKPKWMVVGSIVIVLILFSAVLITGVIPTYGDERIVVDLEGLEIYSIDLTIEQYFNEGVTDEFSFFELLMDQIDEEGVIFVVHISFSVAWQDEDDIQQGVRYWENQGDCFMIDAKDEQGVIDAQAQEYNSPLNNCLIYIDWHGDFTGSCFSLGDFGNY